MGQGLYAVRQPYIHSHNINLTLINPILIIASFFVIVFLFHFTQFQKAAYFSYSSIR